MTDKPDHNHASSHDAIDREKLAEFNARFLRAVERARVVQAAEAERKLRRSQLLKPLLATVAAAVLVCVVGAVLLLKPRPGQLVAPAEAGGFPGVDAVVISSFDRHVVPGIEVFEERADESGQLTEQLVATTDSQGAFHIGVDDRAPERRYVMRHDGEKVGEFYVGPDQNDVQGWQTLSADVRSEQLERRAEVSLAPGEEYALGPVLRLSLDNSASRSWSGSVVHDERWPSEFNFGDVLGGVFYIEGQPPAGLRLRVRVSRDQLALSQVTAGQLRLIARSEEYLAREEALSKGSEGKIALARLMCHRGWYLAGDPPLDSLPATQLTVVSETTDEAWLEWTPEDGRRYALAAPPASDWQAGVLYRLEPGQAVADTPRPNIGLISQSSIHPVSWIYDVEQHLVGSDLPYYLPTYPQANYPTIFALDNKPRGSDALYEEHARMLADAEGGVVPAQYFLRRYDLTTKEPQIQGPFTVDSGFSPGQFEIITGEVELGRVVSLELTGDIELIDSTPDWDFDCDAVPDAFGTDADYLATAPGSYEINVTFRHVSGNHVRVSRRVSVRADGLFACEASGYATSVVVTGAQSPPAEEYPFWVISEKVVAGRPAHSLHITNSAGPHMYIEPPAEWIGKRLKEARMVLYVSPRGGDYEEMFISNGVQAVLATDDPVNGFAEFGVLNGLIDGVETDLAPGCFQTVGVCWPVDLALKAEDDGSMKASARETWLQYFRSPTITWWVSTNLGYDQQNPPPNDELVAILRQFRDSKYFNVKYAKEEKQELSYATLLFGARVEPGMALLLTSSLEHQNLLLASQYEVFSGGDCPARVELETTDGDVYVRYFDYSVLEY